MFVYKITNTVNGKIYTGLTAGTLKDRFQRHITDALHKIKNTHLALAIRKYGVSVFKIEPIEQVFDQELLTKRESYWIRTPDTIKFGYNETAAEYKCGGNTYRSKTKDEMRVIKQKISQTKLGAKNPMARQIKRINIKTKEVDYFDTIISCAQACGIKSGKTSITARLSGKQTKPLKQTWLFEYVTKCVTTTDDECNQVGSEISTDSKRETL